MPRRIVCLIRDANRNSTDSALPAVECLRGKFGLICDVVDEWIAWRAPKQGMQAECPNWFAKGNRSISLASARCKGREQQRMDSAQGDGRDARGFSDVERSGADGLETREAQPLPHFTHTHTHSHTHMP